MSLERCYEVIRRPLVTEKFTRMSQFNQVAFEVAADATKPEIKQAVEKLFKVKVISINTINVGGKTKFYRGRRGQRNGIRKAVAQLDKGQTIDLGATI
ncbi:MAG: 50S ribosomal protein L23 [Alphaproteobacteria bacterium]|nr:50S ribosomal protein L23 [Alphaproteobacteria bacterium]